MNFENAKRLYHNKLRPMLEDQHGVQLEHDRARADTDPELAQRLQRCTNDDRLLKTLLLAALVPEVETLKNLTPARLAAFEQPLEFPGSRPISRETPYSWGEDVEQGA